MKISRTESAFHAADDMCYFTKVVDYRYLVYPLYIINSIDYFWPEFSIAAMTLWAVVLSHMSCALNPLIYAYGMPGFKKALREFFRIHTDQGNTGVNYSCYLRSSAPPKSQSSFTGRLRRSEYEDGEELCDVAILYNVSLVSLVLQ
ncbi:hypothetical protein RB195_018017 [Necator americanus]|uniref:G-protein coupled receptors family 1 profile domain-containing protein n=1 Tax=Necator americanus TaxID=51031 RepID=A0ABR1C7S7_NECAM